MPTPLLMQSVSVTSVTGMNALAVFVFAMPALLAAQRGRRVGLVLALVLVSAHVAFGYVRLNRQPEASTQIAVRIVQPSIDLAEKWDESVRDRVFKTTMDLSARPPQPGTREPQLILWPETSVPFFFTERPDALVAIGEMLKPGQMLVAGAVREEASAGAEPLYYNSVVAIDDTGAIVDAVDKIHLVPFGEYIPFAGLAARLGIGQLVAGPMNFVPGSQRHPITLPGGIAGSPFVCYEIIFPEMIQVDAASSRIIVNLTNDAWFGDTPGPYQHFRQAQVRAVENGVPVLRAANNGISGAIDARGRVLDALALNVRDSLDVEVDVPEMPQAFVPQRQLVGYAIIAFFAVFAFAGVVRRLRAN
jgi:apolipoprotein N-acyltransferase